MVSEVVPDTEEEVKIADGVCNWLAAARKKSDAATSALSSAAPKAAPQSPVVPMTPAIQAAPQSPVVPMTPAIQAAPQSPVVPASSAATPAEAQAAATEFDLDDPASAKSYLLLYWSTQKSKDAAEVYIDYYIQTAKAKATKAEPLSHIIQKEVLKKNILNKPHSREAWIASLKSNRSIRFVPKPKFAA